jgi:hypothetical protein
MAADSDAIQIGNIIRDRRDYSRPDFLADEKEWFSSIQDAVLQDDAPQLATLIKFFSPPIEYIQYELSLAIIGSHLAAARCLLESGAEVDRTIVWHAASRKADRLKCFNLCSRTDGTSTQILEREPHL